MLFITNRNEEISLEINWNGVKSCPSFVINEGQTFGEAARLSGCSCEFCRMCRSEDTTEDLDNSRSCPR